MYPVARRRLVLVPIVLIACAFAAGCEMVEGTSTASAAPNEGLELSGDLGILTYNVAGLPDLISASRPGVNSRLISPLLNRYELALVQEDFVHHAPLTSALEHPYRSRPLIESPTVLNIGDGLSRFSHLPFTGHHREAWTVCHGTLLGQSDCASSKGFSVANTRVHRDVPSLVVVNLHMDAGDGDDDRHARSRQVDQLLSYLSAHHRDDPLVVAGDTNLDTSHPADAATLARLLEGAALEDPCPAPCTGPGRIDRIFVRGGKGVELIAHNWREEREFVDDDGEPLSDHPAVALDVLWRYAAR